MPQFLRIPFHFCIYLFQEEDMPFAPRPPRVPAGGFGREIGRVNRGRCADDSSNVFIWGAHSLSVGGRWGKNAHSSL